MQNLETEITPREKDIICRLIQKIKLSTLCGLLTEAYPTDNPSDTKHKVTEIASLMLKLKSGGYGAKDGPQMGRAEKLENAFTSSSDGLCPEDCSKRVNKIPAVESGSKVPSNGREPGVGIPWCGLYRKELMEKDGQCWKCVECSEASIQSDR